MAVRGRRDRRKAEPPNEAEPPVSVGVHAVRGGTTRARKRHKRVGRQFEGDETDDVAGECAEHVHRPNALSAVVVVWHQAFEMESEKHTQRMGKKQGKSAKVITPAGRH